MAEARKKLDREPKKKLAVEIKLVGFGGGTRKRCAASAAEPEAVGPLVARATYGAVAVMGGFYVLTTWVTVGAVGADQITQTASRATGDLHFNLTATYPAPWVSQLMAVFVATSMFATALALHNVASRYLFSLGRQQCLPGVVGKVHTRYGGPHIASVVVSVITSLSE